MAFAKAGLDRSERVLEGRRIDRLDAIPAAAPFAIYPFDPETCALLTCDLVTYEAALSWERLSAAFEARGFTTRCTLPDESGDLRAETPVIEIAREGSSAVIRAPAVDQVLMELVEPRTLARAVEELVELERDVPSAVFTFANERGTWR